MGRIILVRHAKVNIDNPWIHAGEMKTFIERYDHATIEPPQITEEIHALTESADIELSSKLSRSRETLELFGNRVRDCHAVFNEAGLPYADGKSFKLPAKVWTLIFRLAWLLGYSNHSESYKEAKMRAEVAADLLVSLAADHQTVLLVGHGVMNCLIAKSLKKRGFVLREKTGNKNLAYRIFEF